MHFVHCLCNSDGRLSCDGEACFSAAMSLGFRAFRSGLQLGGGFSTHKHNGLYVVGNGSGVSIMNMATDDLASIDAQMAALEEKRRAILLEQRAAVVAEVKAKIATYKLTAQELGLVAAPQKKPRRRTGSGPVTFRDPDTQETWDGNLNQRGRKPAWVKARIANGTIEQCRVVAAPEER